MSGFGSLVVAGQGLVDCLSKKQTRSAKHAGLRLRWVQQTHGNEEWKINQAPVVEVLTLDLRLIATSLWRPQTFTLIWPPSLFFFFSGSDGGGGGSSDNDRACHFHAVIAFKLLAAVIVWAAAVSAWPGRP